MLNEMPNHIQENIKARLQSGDFLAAKEIRDHWLTNQTTTLSNAQ